MVDMLNAGMEWLSDRRQASLVTNYTYTRSSTSTTIPMQIATAAVEQIGGGDGITITTEDPDFIFLAASLVLDGTTITKPEEGDFIIAASGAKYRVSSIPGESAWRWTTAHRTDIRVHTKEIAS